MSLRPSVLEKFAAAADKNPQLTEQNQLAVNADVPISASEATSQQPVGFQEAGTYINFGAGNLSAPQDNNLTPSNSATATSAAQSPTTAAASGSAQTLMLYAAVGLALLALLGYKISK